MNLLDFTIPEYERLLAALDEAGWDVLTVREFLERGAPAGPSAVVRHDVDRRVENALAMAEAEADHGVSATYYFRTSTFEESVVAETEDLGHEVGYHYEDLAKTRGDVEAARRRFDRNLARFREHADVRTVCAHGSPLSPQQNLDLWRGARDDLAARDVVGEAYLSIDVSPDSALHYLSDTGRTWAGNGSADGTVETTADLREAVRAGVYPELYLLAHPCRWARTRAELARFAAWDVSAEFAKAAAGRVHGLLP